VEFKNGNVTSNNMGNWNHLRMIQEISAQHTRQARHQGTTENSRTEHCGRTSETANVKVQDAYYGKQHDMYNNMKQQNRSNIIYPRETVCFRCST